MEKSYRLIVKNLSLDVDDNRIKELFQQYVTVNHVDVKAKKNVDERTNQFAFLNITATEQNLQTCFRKLNNQVIEGSNISVELAKESFLERLKRERSEDQLKRNDSNNVQKDQIYSNSESLDNVHSTPKSGDREIHQERKHKQSFKDYDDEDENNSFSFKRNTKIIKNDFDNSTKRNHPKERYSNNYEASNISKYKRNKICIPSVRAESDSLDGEYAEAMPILDNDLNESSNNKSGTNIAKNIIVSESEKKRLMSLKQMKQTFKKQKKTIQNGLKLIDSKSNKKIIFDDNLELQELEEINSNKKNTLFNSDDENEEQYQWNEEELDAKANVKQKLLKFQTCIGNDKRFALDKRFVDDDNEEKLKDKNDKNVEDELDEKKWQLNILENVLGKPIRPTDNNEAPKTKKEMIRYDPTSSGHKDYEVIEKPKEDKPVKKKSKIKMTEPKVEAQQVPVQVSQDMYYDVSHKLIESLNKSEGFSLLKTFGSANIDNTKNEIADELNESKGDFQVDFRTKKFKYDSSDTEDEEEVNNENMKHSKVSQSNGSNVKSDSLFFHDNDPRFSEAKQFFKSQPTSEADTFNHTRRKLKEIVRSKIRNNLKKSNPWNRKRIRKVQKSN